MEQLAKVLPKYKENIIVAVVFRKHFEWYVAPKNLWKMDYRRLYDDWHVTYQRRGKSEVEFVKEVAASGRPILFVGTKLSKFSGLGNAEYIILLSKSIYSEG